MDQNGARNEALRGVVEWVRAWQETAPQGTIREEIYKALREAGVALTDDERDRLVQQISNGDEVDVEALGVRNEGGPA